MPHNAGPHTNEHGTILLADFLDARNAEVQNQAREVSSEQDIAAPAEDVQRRSRVPMPSQSLTDGLDRITRHKVLRSGRKAECRQVGERTVDFKLHVTK